MCYHLTDRDAYHSSLLLPPAMRTFLDRLPACRVQCDFQHPYWLIYRTSTRYTPGTSYRLRFEIHKNASSNSSRSRHGPRLVKLLNYGDRCFSRCHDHGE
jgi:hypothetical protein